MPALPTGTVTFLFTDIEGSTRLAQALGDDRWHHAFVDHRRMLQQAVESAGGTIYQDQGESFLMVFQRAKDAAVAAVAAQRALAAHSWPEGGPLRVRIGIHSGEPVLAGNDYAGIDVHRSARICAAGHGGQVLLSEATRGLIVDSLADGMTLRDLGEHRLKDLSSPQRMFQLVAPGLPSEFPPLRSLDALPNNLPVQLTSFVGREEEKADVKRLLSATRLVTLTGSGGAGKTRLALQVAAEVLEEFKDGAWLVELAPLSDPSLVPKTIASALGVPEQPGRTLTETLLDYLRSRSLLLLLDNCEHLLQECAHLADALLRKCSNLRMLATSREALGIAGESIYRVPSLSLPDLERRPPLEMLVQYEGVRLFQERAVASVREFAVTGRNAAAVVQVCQRLDGIPLAIELAAARVKVLSVEQIAQRLDDRFHLLTGGSRTALPRHQTLRAALDWSYELLVEKERRLLRRLSVFAGGWILEAGERICSGDGLGAADILDLLAQLIEKSLVLVDRHDGEVRYRLLETVRQYGLDKLLEAGETATVRKTHRDWFLEFAERAELQMHGPDTILWLDRLERDHDNLRLAMEWSLEQEEIEAALRLASALNWFWNGRGHFTEGRAWLDRGLAEGKDISASVRAKAFYAAGHLASMLGYVERAESLVTESLALYKKQGNEKGIVDSLIVLGRVALRQGDTHRAVGLLTDGLSVSRKMGDESYIIRTLYWLGEVALATADFERAKSSLEEALVFWGKFGTKRGMAVSLMKLGEVAARQGHYERASALCDEAVALVREVRVNMTIATSLAVRASVARLQGDYGLGIASCEESLGLFRELGDREGAAFVTWLLGDMLLRQDEYKRAQEMCEESLSLTREGGDAEVIACSLGSLGRLAQRRGDLSTASSLYVQSLSLQKRRGDKWGIAACLERVAGLARAHGQMQRAARVFGAAEALRIAIGGPLPAADRTEYESDVAAVRVALPDGPFRAAWEDGKAMTLEQAIEYALSE